MEIQIERQWFSFNSMHLKCGLKMTAFFNWGQHRCVSKLYHHWFRYWLVACSAPSHYLNQRWYIVNQTLRNKHRWIVIFIFTSVGCTLCCEQFFILFLRAIWSGRRYLEFVYMSLKCLIDVNKLSLITYKWLFIITFCDVYSRLLRYNMGCFSLWHFGKWARYFGLLFD